MRIFLAVLAVAALPMAAAKAQDPAVPAALAAASRNDWVQAYAQAAQSGDPLVSKVVRWLDYTHNLSGGRFAEIADFITHNPSWPHQKTLRRHAEAALAAETDDTAAAWLKAHPPVSAAGKVRLAELTIKGGKAAEGTAMLRAAWVEEDFLPGDERGFWARYGSTMRPEDNERRLDRLLWDGDRDGARRMIPLVPAEYQKLAEARLALETGAHDAAAAVGKVPAELQSTPGLVFDEVRWRRKQDMNDDAGRLLLAHPDNAVRPLSWWSERQIVARRLLAGGNAELAYNIVQQHGLSDGRSYSEAEFLSGYIALRYLKKPEIAFEHFAHILARVDTPYGKSRAAYWSGRAAEAQGKHDLALKWYAAGAENMATFYGQLAAHELGDDAPPHPVPEPKATAAEQAKFDAGETVRAAALFAAAGDRDDTRIFVAHLAETVQGRMEFAMLAAFAEAHGRIDLAIHVARHAMDAGTPLMVHGYPVTALPPGGTIEAPLVYAIVRQESAFDQYAVSRAGARGLMQLMPGTAATLARKMSISYSPGQLTGDGAYNIMLGRTYLEGLLEDFGGSYALAIAGYNAGPGRIRQWLRDYGDPRGKDVSMVDWIETIPFTETRVYVQRVLENLQVYRGQNVNSATAFSLVSDLAR
ncbi:MAG TPA: lytic transglycosylase domain-containing protein [Stellaceae bacterium]|nr:lytic transglycosylase domain-containing protein [Stellaceae bacterium]